MKALKSVDITSVVCLVLIAFSGSGVAKKRQRWSVKIAHYYTIVDAAKMSSTLGVFRFDRYSEKDVVALVMYNETVVPGLRAYAATPEMAVQGISDAVKNAKEVIPETKYNTTYLMLIATGLSHLPGHQATDLLDVMQKYFYTTGLLVDQNSVSTMHSRKEFFLWLTVNLLLRRLMKKRATTISVADLGSTSVHEAVQIQNVTELDRSFRKYLRNVTAFGKNYTVLGHSTIGLGLYEARIKFLNLDLKNSTKMFTSECIHPKIVGTWWFDGQLHKIRGANTTTGTVDFPVCMNVSRNIVDRYPKGYSLNGQEIFATSHFYHTMITARFAKPRKNVTLTLEQIKNKAMEVCKTPKPKSLFLCMDLVYVYTLFLDFFSVSDSSTISFVYQLRGQAVTWSMGAAFQKYEEQVNGNKMYLK